jgi:hypothetical protein
MSVVVEKSGRLSKPRTALVETSPVAAHRTREAQRALVARYARREKSVDPAGDTRRAYGSVEGRGEHGGRVRSVQRVAAKSI